MFSSVRASDSPIYKKKNQRFSSNESSRLSRSMLSPAITSTPLNSISMNNRRNGSLTPIRNRRGSLSDVAITPPKYMNSIEPTMSKLVQNASGPLLTSAQYNVNLSTYVDTKSPGYVGRLVQYHEEREMSQPTHQTRYNSPGVFPIVHLYKKDLPIMSPKPKKVMIRIAPSDSSRFNSPDHDKLLLEDMMHETSSSRTSQQKETSNKSVIDALKEISRKRIHPGEEYDLHEEAVKRLRPDCLNGDGDGDSFYRSREESPKIDTKSINGTSKKICYVDPFYASSTSTTLEKERLKKVLAIPGEKTSIRVEEAKKDKKDAGVQLVSVETQTTSSEVISPESNKEPVKNAIEETPRKGDQSNEERSPKPVRKQPLRIFDEKPLEIIRKNRLAVLLGALAGEKPVLIPREDKLAKFREEMEREEEEEKRKEQGEVKESSKSEINTTPKSILSCGGRKSEGTEKHVTFAFPISSATTTTDQPPQQASSQSSLPKYSPTITQTSTSLITPVMSSSVSDSPSFSVTSRYNSFTSPVQTSPAAPSQLSPAFNFGSKNEATKKSEPVQITLGATQMGESKSKNEQNVLQSSASKASLPEASKLGPSFSFAPANTTVSSVVTFNFGSNVSGSQTSGTSSSAGPLTFASPSTTAVSVSSQGLKMGVTPSTSPPKVGGFKFDLKSTPTIAANTSPGKPETTSTLMIQQNNETPKSAFGQAAAASGANQSNFSFVPSAATAASTLTTSSNAISATFTFNKGPAFGNASTASTTSSDQMFKFGGTTHESKPAPTSATQPAFGISTAPGGFSFGKTSASSFGTTKTESQTTTAATTANSFVSGNSGFSFGNTAGTAPLGASAPATENKPMFGNTNTTAAAPVFGNVPSSSTAFGGTSTTPVFGAAASTSVPTFGTPSNTQTSNFQAGSNALPTFGNNSTPGTTSGAPKFTSFVTSASSTGFGSNTGSSLFSTTTSVTSAATSSAPTFGFGSTFGNKTVTSPFGANNIPTTTSASMFGVPTTTSSGFALGSKPTFNMPAGSTSSPFGSSASSPFGATTQATPAFGSTTGTATFGAPSTNFGMTTTSASAFGSASTTSAFGPTVVTPFGAPTTTSVTGLGSSTTSSSIFGTNTTTAFGSTNTGFGNAAKPLFGGSATGSGFGSGSSTTTTATGFGTNATPTFAFGAASPTTTSTFGVNSTPAFGTTTTANNTFGSGTTPAFGSSGSFSANPLFGNAANTSSVAPVTTSTPSFGSSSGFGSGGSSFGSNSSGGFGTSSGFGSNAPTTNTFGAATNTTNNTFGSGFGSGNTSAFGGKSQTNFTAPATNSFTPTTNSFGNAPAGTGFGQNAAGFSSNQPAQSGVFTFGSSNVQSNTSGFSFGSAEPPKPSFNFTPGNNTPAFGAAPAPAFGSNPTPTFGANPAGQFQTPGMFSIGSGPTQRNRTQLRAKRRTDKN